MNARRTVGAVRAPMDRMDEGRQPDIRHGPRRQGPLQPGIESAGGDAQPPAHHPNRKGGLIRFHEPEDRFVFGAVSCANQAAAFDKMSRSTFSCRFSRRSRGQFRTFGGGETIGPTSGVAIGLGHPVADRLRRRFKLAGEVLGGTSGSDQRDQLFAKLRRIRSSGSWHRGLLLPQGLGVHESGSGPDTATKGRSARARLRGHATAES